MYFFTYGILHKLQRTVVEKSRLLDDYGLAYVEAIAAYATCGASESDADIFFDKDGLPTLTPTYCSVCFPKTP